MNSPNSWLQNQRPQPKAGSFARNRILANGIAGRLDVKRSRRWSPVAISESARLALAAVLPSFAVVRLQKGNNLCAIVRRGDAAIGLHFVAGHHLLWIGDEAVERGLVPHQAGVL